MFADKHNPIVVHVEDVDSGASEVILAKDILQFTSAYLTQMPVPHRITVDAESIKSADFVEVLRTMSERLMQRFDAQPGSLHVQIAVMVLKERSRPHAEMPFVFVASKIRGDDLALAVTSPPSTEMPDGFYEFVVHKLGVELRDLLTKSKDINPAAANYARIIRYQISRALMTDVLCMRRRPENVTLQ